IRQFESGGGPSVSRESETPVADHGQIEPIQWKHLGGPADDELTTDGEAEVTVQDRPLQVPQVDVAEAPVGIRGGLSPGGQLKLEVLHSRDAEVSHRETHILRGPKAVVLLSGIPVWLKAQHRRRVRLRDLRAGNWRPKD